MLTYIHEPKPSQRRWTKLVLDVERGSLVAFAQNASEFKAQELITAQVAAAGYDVA